MGLLPVKLIGDGCDTPLAHFIPDLTTRSLHFTTQLPNAPLQWKYLIFECVSYAFQDCTSSS